MVVITFHDKFSRRIGRLLEGGFTDAILLVEGVEVPVHKCILAVQSEYFRHLFSLRKGSRQTADQRGSASGLQDIVELDDDSLSNHQSLVEINNVTVPLTDNVFELKNTTVEVVKAVLDYFYRGEYNFHENVESHLLALELSHKFRLMDLEEILINNLVKSITVENFFDFYNMKMRYTNVQLKNSCVNFLKENGEEIAKSANFSKLTRISLLSLLDSESFAAAEIDIFRAAERWAGANKPNEKTVKRIVDNIRLATISQKDLFDIVSTSKKLPSIDIMEPIRSITNEDAASTNFRLQQNMPYPVPDMNVAQINLGAEVLSGSVTGGDLVSGSSGCTSHRVGGKPDCIVVKLDQTYRLNTLKLILDSNEGRSYKYTVEVSVDGEGWLRVVDYSNYWCRSNQFLRFDPRAVRFIRMTGTNCTILKITSFEAMFTEEECSLVQGITVAYTNVVLESRGATVTGLSGYHGKGELFEPMGCIDGKEDSGAGVKEGFPLIVKLGQPYWLSSVRIRSDSYGTSYTIESSPDGESWQRVGGERHEQLGRVWHTFEFSRRVVLQFRVTEKNLNPYYFVGLVHFESPASTITVTN